MHGPQPTPLLTTGAVAHVLGVSRQHVVDLCEQGLLEFVRRPLSRPEEQSLWLHRVLLAKLCTDTDFILALGRRNLGRLNTQHNTRGMTAHWLRRTA